MSDHVCLDSSVLVKMLTWEDGSETAARLMDRIIEDDRIIILPSFAWVEVGSVLRQKVARKEIDQGEAEIAWDKFCSLKLSAYDDDQELWSLAWSVSVAENLSTLYDAAFLAVAELATKKSGSGPCLFWTADEKLVNSLQGRKDCVRLLRDFA